MIQRPNVKKRFARQISCCLFIMRYSPAFFWNVYFLTQSTCRFLPARQNTFHNHGHSLELQKRNSIIPNLKDCAYIDFYDTPNNTINEFKQWYQYIFVNILFSLTCLITKHHIKQFVIFFVYFHKLLAQSCSRLAI